MNTRVLKSIATVSIFLSMCFLPACGPQTHLSPNPFPSETAEVTLTPTPTGTSLPVPVVPTPTLSCSDGLTFEDDLTIPDNSVVKPESLLDKKWQVLNSGTCNWDDRYRLRLISGDALGVAPEQSLYPARAGTEATIEILFKAPSDAGNYVSEWQAFDANGIPFGDSFYMKITVEP